ncbi:uncharacterized protein HfgLR_02935 [Haloferax gibbonsii]|uniref:Uncharacterized protein n=1 Tax=Haloferax gibbonsii TaxID=35746 RepID=A0A871BD44_HALGI|nr:hypothetical protein [Haloferax gibbonsii]QOS10736.1 uncharacterized protein HfgLR_02935 [Haloferax gibbonsii]
MPPERTKRQPNRELLRNLASGFGDEPWLSSIAVFPANRPDSIVLTVRPLYYPESVVDAAYIEVQAYTDGTFHITYVESRHGDRWLCRWDRHDSPDYSRDHFHEPPAARHSDGVNRDYPLHLGDVLADVVVPWVNRRVGVVWDNYEG